MYTISNSTWELLKRGKYQTVRIEVKESPVSSAVGRTWTSGNIRNGTFSLRRSVTATGAYSIGEVAAATVDCVLMVKNGYELLTSGQIYKELFEISIGVKDWENGGEITEWIPLGEFYLREVRDVTNAHSAAEGYSVATASVTFYDGMTETENIVPEDSVLFTDEFTPDEMLLQIASECLGKNSYVKKGTTPSYWQRTNGVPKFLLKAEQNKYSPVTYRTLISDLAEIYGSSAYINETGEIALVQQTMTDTVSVPPESLIISGYHDTDKRHVGDYGTFGEICFIPQTAEDGTYREFTSGAHPESGVYTVRDTVLRAVANGQTELDTEDECYQMIADHIASVHFTAENNGVFSAATVKYDTVSALPHVFPYDVMGIRNDNQASKPVVRFSPAVCEYKLNGRSIVESAGGGELKAGASPFTSAQGSIIAQLSNKADTSVKSTVLHYYLSTSTESPMGGEWLSYAPTWVDGKYLWQRTYVTLQNGSTYYSPDENGVCVAGSTGDTGPQGAQGVPGEKGDKGDTGPQGAQGVPGEKGDKGDNGNTSYFHIKYSAVANPTSSSQMSETPNVYIGTYVDFTEADSTDPSKYTWAQFKGSQGAKGDQGIAGVNGANGQTSYLHIAYATNSTGTSGFSVSDSVNKTYIGQYTDFTEADSTDASKYSWTKIKGDTGAQGAKGDKGDTGATGAQGAQGPKGDKGDTGAQGPQGIQGPQGNTGPQGVSVQAVRTQYYLSTSNTTTSGGTWSNDIPAFVKGKYYWKREVVTLSNGTEAVSGAVLARDVNEVNEAILNWAVSNDLVYIDGAKIYASDLFVIAAKIAGFNINQSAIYSQNKSSLGSNSPGIYLGSNGTMNIGNANYGMKFDGENLSAKFENLYLEASNLEIGGENLIDLVNMSQAGEVSFEYDLQEGTFFGTSGQTPVYLPLKIKAGETYTFSVGNVTNSLAINGSANRVYIAIQDMGGTNVYLPSSSVISKNTAMTAYSNGWLVASNALMTFTVPSGWKYPHLQFHTTLQGGSGSYSVQYMKVESGNLKTKWTANISYILDAIIKASYAWETPLSNAIESVMGEVNEKIDGIQVGGRNLLKNTDAGSGVVQTDTWNATNWLFNSGGNGTFQIVDLTSDNSIPTKYAYGIRNNTSGNRDYIQECSSLVSGETYTASWYARVVDGDSVNMLCRLYRRDTGGVYKIIYSGVITNATWKRFTYTWVQDVDEVTTIQFGLSGFGSIDITAMKVEKGNKATDWSPAPEDIQAQIDSKADVNHTHTRSQITDFPSSLPASDVYSWAKQSSKPSYAWSEITGKPSTFAPSSHTQAASTITGLATVATSGNYNDLSSKPSIPSVGNGKITITQNGTSKGSFTMNQSGNTTIALTDTDTNTTYSAATTSANGLMTSAMVTKLNGIAAGANAYSLPTASRSTLGGVKTTSTVTSTSGLTACPIISGVPYYKDTNTTYSLSSFGLTATAGELNYCDGVTSNIQTQLNNKASSSHTHEGVVLYSANMGSAIYANGSATASSTNSVTISDSNFQYKRLKITAQINNVGQKTEEIDLTDRLYNPYFGTSARFISFCMPQCYQYSGYVPYQEMGIVLISLSKTDTGYRVMVIDSGYYDMGMPETPTATWQTTGSKKVVGTTYVNWEQRHQATYCVTKIVGYTWI